jgi:hypothetical protein
MASQARIVLNARVHADPDALHREAESVLRQVLHARGLPWRVHAKAHFRPGRPVPIHRVAR